MKKSIVSMAVGLCLCSSLSYAGNAITDNVNDDHVVAGDYIQVALPLTGLFAAWLHDDAEGAKQLTYSLATTVGIVQAGKYAIGRVRPNASNYASFPSGHTAAAFSGAAFLQSRYGAKWGIPAYLAASYVGASRIHGNRHYADDVVAGAGIAFLTNQFFVSEYTPEGVNLGVAPLKDGMMLNFSLTNDALNYDSKRQRSKLNTQKVRRHSFTLDIGFNLHDSIGDIGASSALKGSSQVDEHQPFSNATYAYQLDKTSAIEVQLSPNETRRYGLATNDFMLGDKAYSKDDSLLVALRQWSIGASYLKSYQLIENVDFTAGVGLHAYYVELEVDRVNGGAHSSLSSTPILPSVTAKLEYQLSQNWSAHARVDYQALDKDKVFSSEGGVTYQVNPEWDIDLKYSHTNNRWNSSAAQYRSDSVVFAVTNHF
ncbi:phosphatase PAP2 family protein [Vibrio tubiashii]|uniref:undecaprenyl-diphosphate phosphatase n=1 Tax=Vibrio tubiashii ATCC 19109 TaxID=1051646 RepID=F9T6F0_9VIBR|nr:phosphatase PAP2 family protein [Vibrio tubiashii]AIW16697.1 phosphoesterase PA-phosphatase [Vibrio tubiashii ATCC 19109]EGU54613.1 phosphoesterase, PA-phosphatase related protein [Vibrio tubiashii ATCC 19109]EIF02043.1 PA-phosphatase-like phosphoesterase [Vibrio tubiashii NCIMB 1337 = ATCC 19106]